MEWCTAHRQHVAAHMDCTRVHAVVDAIWMRCTWIGNRARAGWMHAVRMRHLHEPRTVCGSKLHTGGWGWDQNRSGRVRTTQSYSAPSAAYARIGNGLAGV